MAEYIEKSGFKAWLLKQKRLSKLLVVMALEETPAADVVEVVRCKDCVKRGTVTCAFADEYDYDLCADDDFCSYGERRDDHAAD